MVFRVARLLPGKSIYSEEKKKKTKKTGTRPDSCAISGCSLQPRIKNPLRAFIQKSLQRFCMQPKVLG